MKNKISKKIFRRAVLPLVTLTFLSSTALGLADPAAKGDVSVQLPSQQVITKGAGQQKTIAVGKISEALGKQAPSQKSSQGIVSSGVKSLISRFESWTNKVVSTVKTVIMPKLGTKTQSITKKQSPVVEGVSSTNLRSLPQVPVVKKEVVQPIEIKKNTSLLTPKSAVLLSEELTSGAVETIASLLVSKPVVSEVTEVEVPSPPPLPKLGPLAPVPSSAEVKNASDAVDELVTTIKETAKVNDEISDNEQKIDKLVAQTKALEEESLQGAEKQNVLLSNLKTQRTEPVSRESFLESIKNPHALKKVITQPKQEIVLQPDTLLDTLKQSLAARRVVVAEEEAGEDVQDLSLAVESATLLTPLKKTIDEVIIDNLTAIEAVQMKIAALKPTAELPLETGFTKQAQQQNRARSQAIKEIEKLNGEINVYHKNNALLMAQKTTQQEEIALKQQKVLSKLKAKQAEPQSEGLLESIRKQTILKKVNNPPEESSGNTAKVQQKPGGVINSLEQKMEEFKQKLPIASHHIYDEDEDWE